MATQLEKTIKRELSIDGRTYTLTFAPDGLKITLKGKRKGLELPWRALVSGESALTAALNASLGNLSPEEPSTPEPLS